MISVWFFPYICTGINKTFRACRTYKLKKTDAMTKIEQLNYIDRFHYDNLSKDELRMLILEMLQDDSLFRSFRLFAPVK